MKKYICKCENCIACIGKKPCILICEIDLLPIGCPYDNRIPNNTVWELIE